MWYQGFFRLVSDTTLREILSALRLNYGLERSPRSIVCPTQLSPHFKVKFGELYIAAAEIEERGESLKIRLHLGTSFLYFWGCFSLWSEGLIEWGTQCSAVGAPGGTSAAGLDFGSTKGCPSGTGFSNFFLFLRFRRQFYIILRISL